MTDQTPAEVFERPFGADSREHMLAQYFSAIPVVTPADAWKHVYQLLLWIDRTTGLAHCYESDKAQPGRPWYARSLAFHAWVARALGTTSEGLAGEIDWLFKEATRRLAVSLQRERQRRAASAAKQREPYEGQGLPVPGEDPELESLILTDVGPWLTEFPPREVLQVLTERIWTYLSQENKRKNLVGEGFEDVLAFIIKRLPGGELLDVRTRPVLHQLPGFHAPPAREKARKVDLAIVGPGERRQLLSVKWSIRADREEQFGVDLATYERLESAGRDFDFVLVTNEFDPARLVAACQRRRPGPYLFTSVVHVNPAGPLATYGAGASQAAVQLPTLVKDGRLISLERWLSTLI
jgi:hypothetical protein